MYLPHEDRELNSFHKQNKNISSSGYHLSHKANSHKQLVRNSAVNYHALNYCSKIWSQKYWEISSKYRLKHAFCRNSLALLLYNTVHKNDSINLVVHALTCMVKINTI